MAKWWWPFGKHEDQEEAENEFNSQLKEALLIQDDLKAATEALKKDRIERLKKTSGGIPRPKLDSQPTG